MTAVQIHDDDDYYLSGDDGTPSPFLYANLDMSQGSDDLVITDLSGNGHHLNWVTTLGTATVPVGTRQTDHILFPATAVTGDIWIASTVAEYPLFDLTQSGIYVSRYVLSALPGATMAAGLCARSGTSGATDAGYQHTIDNANKPKFLYHDGTSTLSAETVSTAITTDEPVTHMVAWDATSLTATVVAASHTAHVQYETDTDTGALTLPTSTRVNKATFGARGSGVGGYNADRIKDAAFYRLHCYHDPDGGALPANLGDLCRFLHQNPEALIPASWWS